MAKQHSKKSSFAMLQPFSTKFGAKIAQNQRIKKLSFKFLIFSPITPTLPNPPITPIIPINPIHPILPQTQRSPQHQSRWELP